MSRIIGFLSGVLTFAVLSAGVLPAAAQDGPKLTIGLAGIPPVFVNTQAYVAEQQGFFKKYGANVTLRPFDSGAAAARAVASGNIELSFSPSPLIGTMISNNPNVDLVAIYGWEKSDWLLASLDPRLSKCEDVKGKPVGVDSLGGARSIALNVMLRKCGLTANDTQQVPLSANVGTAMISGQIPFGVLHIDDVPIVEREAKKKLTTIIDINDVVKVDHYLALTTTRKLANERRDALVKVVAAFIEAGRFIRDPKNIDLVAKDAAPTGRSVEDAKYAIIQYNKMGFWPSDNGLKKENVEAAIATQKRVGNIKGNPVSYDRYVDLSIYDAAVKLVK